LLVALARNTTLRSSGTSRIPSRQAFSCSWANERFKPKSEVNTTRAHSRPAAICRMSNWLEVCESAAP
jgi:hypothetical protein